MSDTDDTIPDAIREEAFRLAGISQVQSGKSDLPISDAESAKASPIFPSSWAQIFCNFVGFIAVIIGVVVLLQGFSDGSNVNWVIGLTTIAYGGLLIAFGSLIQYLFDIRHLIILNREGKDA